MKSIIPVLTALAVLFAGCTYPEERYSTVPVYGDDVIVSSPARPAPVYEPVLPVSPPVSPPPVSSDQQLLTSIRHQFDRYGELGGSLPNIDIEARNGTVTLSGTVPGEKEKQMIDAMVRNTRGVVDVNNRLNVSDSRVSVQPTGRAEETSRVYAESAGDIFNLHVESLNDTDRALAQRILSGLRTDTVLASSLPKVNIRVEDGAVVLQGNVQSELQRDTIAAAVQRAAGSSPVRNELRVQPVR